MKTLTRQEIEEVLPTLDLLSAIESGFTAYSEGRAVVPPVGELILDKGEVHIKYGYIKEENYYVIKIASGFYGNAALGLPSGNGAMLLYSQETGEPACVLFDEGHLTDVRTAVAGAIAAKYIAPRHIDRIGIAGTGVQARLQLRHLAAVTDCKRVVVWGRGKKQTSFYRDELSAEGYEVMIAKAANDLLAECNLIVTTTPSTAPLLTAKGLRPGTHITAVGSDTPHKQELDADILQRADVVVADSIEQCLVRGEICQAIKSGRLAQEDIVELGDVIAGRVDGRTSEEQITVADLTGVAVQDIKIAEAVFRAAG
jgi:ornithine cyclodeaminase